MGKVKKQLFFKSISLENIGCFGSKQTIQFTRPDGSINRWNILIGENGTGKTTVLRALCFLEDRHLPFFAHTPASEIAESIFRNKESAAKINLFIGDERWDDSMEFQLSHSLPYLHSGALIDEKEMKCRLYTYRANRTLEPESSKDIGSSDKFWGILDDNLSLKNPETWLLEADHLAARDKSYEVKKQQVQAMLKNILREQVSDIEIRVPENGKRSIGPLRVYFKTDFGWVTLQQLSLGYQTLVAWMVDLASRLLDEYPDSSNPLAEEAVVLVDELDLHLHPKMQRDLIQFLSETFPKIQFIVTAHSPLVLQSLEDANIILLKKEGDEVRVHQNPVDISNWRIDQILNSDLYGVDTRSPKVEKALAERRTLLAKPKLSKRDLQRAEELESMVGQLPTWNSKNEKTATSAIDTLIEMLEKKQATAKS